MKRDFDKQINADEFVLEIGCGSGCVLYEIVKRYRLAKAVGIDVAFKDRIEDGAISFMSANLNESWPFETGSVDRLVGMMILEHLFDPFHSFSEIKRVLKPTGKAYINLPLVTGIKNRLRLLTGKLPTTSRGMDVWFDMREWDGGHLHYFSLASIHRVAGANGLKVDQIAAVGRMRGLKTAMAGLLAGEITFSVSHC